jgi:hypothetical protein
MKVVSRKMFFTKLSVIFAVAAFVFGIQMFSTRFGKVSASATGPTPSHTGAPDEANCTACHGDFPVNSGTGSVTITGVPANYTPNQQYQITVRTSQVGATIYGFQMTAVDSLGRKAGTYTLPSQMPARLQLDKGFVGNNFRQYIEHTVDGIVPAQFDFNEWSFTWTAPGTRVGKISFHAAGNAANSDGNVSGDYIYTTSKASLSSAVNANFDGDGKSDISIYRPSAGEWWINRSSSSQTIAAQFGNSSDKIVPADFSGDGKTDIAFWRPSTGEWFILRSEDSSFYSVPFGAAGDVPAPADYDADGKADTAVFRPSSGTWFINKSGGGTDIVPFGQTGDVPVTGDYDGDGKSDIAIFRPSNGQWWLNRSSAGVVAASFGITSDKPVQGDYSGDGKTDIAFWRPSTGEWFILRSEDSSFYSIPFGAAGDTPSPGDYDGDGKTDPAVFRAGVWYIQRSSTGILIVNFGLPGDVPVPSGYLPQ